MKTQARQTPILAAGLSRSWRYRCPVGVRMAIALCLVSLAWVITYTLRTSVDAPSFQTPFFVCAIVLCSWIGGFGPAIVATLLSIFLIEFTFTEPLFTIGFRLDELPKFFVFLLTGSFIGLLARRQREDELALLAAREGLEEKVRERTSELQNANDRLVEEVAERTRAEKELQRLNRIWRVRSAINHSVTRSSSEAEFVATVCRTIVELGGCHIAWMADAADWSTPKAYACQDDMGDCSPAWSPGSIGLRLAKQAIQAPDAPSFAKVSRNDPDYDGWTTACGAHSVIALPLELADKPLGCLLLYSLETEAFDEKEAVLLQQAANYIAQGVTLFRMRQEHDVAEAELKKTQSELARVARLTTIGELTASIAHEINQPLAAVVTNASAAQRWLNREPPNLEEGCAAIQRIIRDGKRGSEVLARIRALLKKQETERETLSIKDAVEEILALTHSELQGVALEVELEDGLSNPIADRVQIQQVLLNLILNAADIMANQARTTKQIHISAHEEASQIIVAVRDTGPGIAGLPEQLFEAFYSTKKNGLGIGLSICRSIIEAHGGRLWAENHESGGAVFQFTLPVNSTNKSN
ncbi:ATP-binding protein [Cerasicoccus frondis]|uniref:ATP-binding protein n=1 Tax=Cerasicoccus frondis TaxID=490090 RepID=UPI002852D5FA|nr:ATP-binding protein [Cerasicoccus frondis]